MRAGCVIHRDVTPQNILLNTNGIVKLADEDILALDAAEGPDLQS